MDRMDFNAEADRVVEIKVPHGSGEYSLSGFLVADGLVLTCAHNVVGKRGIIAKPASEPTRWREAEVRWPTAAHPQVDSELVDVALLEVPGLRAPSGLPLVWGEYNGFVGSVPVGCLGFPRAAMEDDAGYHLTPVLGDFVPGEGMLLQRMIFNVTSPHPAAVEGWKGLSGAMIRDDSGLLLGVAAEVSHTWVGRFRAVPASLILAQEELRRLLGNPELQSIPAEHAVIKPAIEPLGEETDFKLITARYGQVGFVNASHGRELDDLAEWCQDAPSETDGSATVRVLTGPGGSGKTRLAAELCSRLQASSEEWEAGFAREDEFAQWSDYRPRRPTLIVFDYVERPTITSKVVQFLSRLDQLGSRLTHPVRVLLVSRTTANWLEQINAGLARKLRIEQETVITENQFTDAMRRLHFVKAYERFVRSETAPRPPADHYFQMLDGRFDSPLLVHIAALLAARGSDLPYGARAGRLQNELLDYLVQRERMERWAAESTLTANTGHHPEQSPQALEAVAIMTLTAPTAHQAEEFLKASSLWNDQGNIFRREAASAVIRLYPGFAPHDPMAPMRAAPIEPDLISEHLLVSVEDLGGIIGRLFACPLDNHHFTRMLHILSLTCDHYPHARLYFHQALRLTFERLTERGESIASISEVLGQSLPRLIDTAVKEAVGRHDTTVAELLADKLTELIDDAEAVRVIAETGFPEGLNDPGLIRLKRTLQELSNRHYRNQDDRQSLAGGLSGLIATLTNLQEWPEALAALREAAGLEPGSAHDPYPGFRSDLGTVMSGHLAIGEVEPALDILAAEVLRRVGIGESGADIIDWTLEEMQSMDGHASAFDGLAQRIITDLFDREERAEPLFARRVLGLFEGFADRFAGRGGETDAFAAVSRAVRIRAAFPSPDESGFESSVALLERVQERLLTASEGLPPDETVPNGPREVRELIAKLYPRERLRLADRLERQAVRAWHLGEHRRAVNRFKEAVQVHRGAQKDESVVPEEALPAARDLAVALWNCGDRVEANAWFERVLTSTRGSMKPRPDRLLVLLEALEKRAFAAWSTSNQRKATVLLGEAGDQVLAIAGKRKRVNLLHAIDLAADREPYSRVGEPDFGGLETLEELVEAAAKIRPSAWLMLSIASARIDPASEAPGRRADTEGEGDPLDVGVQRFMKSTGLLKRKETRPVLLTLAGVALIVVLVTVTNALWPGPSEPPTFEVGGCLRLDAETGTTAIRCDEASEDDYEIAYDSAGINGCTLNSQIDRWVRSPDDPERFFCLVSFGSGAEVQATEESTTTPTSEASASQQADTSAETGGESDAETFYDQFVGHWYGTADDPGSSTDYDVDLTLTATEAGEVGSIVYPGLDCSGTLTLEFIDESNERIVLRENITDEPYLQCIEEGWINLYRQDDGDVYFEYFSDFDQIDNPPAAGVTATLARP